MTEAFATKFHYTSMLLASSALRRGPSGSCVARVLRQRTSMQFLSSTASTSDGDKNDDDGEDVSPADVDETVTTASDVVDVNSGGASESGGGEVSDISSSDVTSDETAQIKQPDGGGESADANEDFLTTMSLRPKEVVNELEARFEGIAEDLEVAIIGCYVNGPGESKAADVGLTGGPSNLLYVNGTPSKKVSNEKLVDTIEEQVKEQLQKKSAIDIIAKG